MLHVVLIVRLMGSNQNRIVKIKVL